MPERVVTYCRTCQASCGILLDIERGHVVGVRGDMENPTSEGYTCPKGRAIGDFHHHPDRLLSSMRRRADGAWEPIDSAAVVKEVAERLLQIRDTHGPDAIASFWGTMANVVTLTKPVALKWWKALGSHKAFSTATIDQIAKPVADARMGKYLGGMQRHLNADVCLVAGGNPSVSMFALPMWGLDVPFPIARLRQAKDRGMKLIVVDPRLTETARLADIHLQLLPGTDAVLFAALLHVIFRDGLDDPAFWRRYAAGVDQLREAVATLTPERAGRHCGIAPESIVAAARMFGKAERGTAGGATGTDMAPRSNLTEQLIGSLNVVCGRFLREGEPVEDTGILAPAERRRAQVAPPARTWEAGWRSRTGFGLLPSPHGGELPATMLPEEVLTDGADRVRALVVIAGNPVAAIPDQDRVIEALRSLELLVTIDPWMSETARLADYVIAPTMALERPDHTGMVESVLSVPVAHYTPAVLPRPGDVIEDWEFFWELSEHMGLDIGFRSGTDPAGSVSTRTGKPTSEQLLEILASRGRIDLDAVKAKPHGMRIEPDPALVVLPPDPGTEHHRLELFPQDVEAEFAAMIREDLENAGPSTQFHLVVRRMKETFNSSGRNIKRLRRTDTNPLFVHPDDLALLGIQPGARLRVCSDHGVIEADTVEDATLRQGVVAMNHCWGGLPDEDDPHESGVGSNTGRLSSRTADTEAISNMPRLTAIPVDLIPIST